MTVFEAAAADTNGSITQRLKMVGDRVVSLPIVATEDRHAMISTRPAAASQPGAATHLPYPAPLAH